VAIRSRTSGVSFVGRAMRWIVPARPARGALEV